jgi:hypothetical protein
MHAIDDLETGAIVGLTVRLTRLPSPSSRRLRAAPGSAVIDGLSALAELNRSVERNVSQCAHEDDLYP